MSARFRRNHEREDGEMSGDIASMIITRLESIDNKLDNVLRNGCCKAELHEKASERLTELEKTQAEYKGRIMVIGVVASAAFAVLCQWIGKHL